MTHLMTHLTRALHPVRTRLLLLAAATLITAVSARAQISLATAVDLALTNNPRVKLAQADAAKAAAALSQTKDVYIPSLNAGAGLGQSYGYSQYPPTLFTFNAGSLVYGASQRSYIHSAHAGVTAAQFALEDARETVAEDAALTFVALDHDQKREEVLHTQSGYATHLVTIVQDRYDAGQDTLLDLTTAKLTAAQLRLSSLRAQDDSANDRNHLQRLMSMPPGPLTAEGGFPATPLPLDVLPSISPANPAIASAFANADAKQFQARAEATYLYRPQINLVVQYNRYATFTDSFKQIQKQYLDSTGHTTIGANEEVIGVQIGFPLYDKLHRAKAREAAADAAHALHEAENVQITVLDAQTKLTHTVQELQARADVAALEQQIAQQQLAILQVQLNQPTSGAAPPMTPKDEQNQRIAERDKYLNVLDTAFQLQQAEISLLRQTGHLEEWLHQSAATTTPHP